MDEGEPPPDPPGEAPAGGAPEFNLKDLHRQVKETERRWAQEGDSESLWEEEHGLLIKLQVAGDVSSLMKRARRAKKATGPRGSPADLAQASLGLWVLERYGEAEAVLRTAVQRLRGNRYPWSLLLRHLSWGRDPQEAMDFIVSSLDSVPWKAYALVQLGTLCVDAASRHLKRDELDACEACLGEARGHLDRACAQEGCSSDMRRTAERLLMLVETLGTRVQAARSATLDGATDGETPEMGLHRLEQGMREVAETITM
jgi:hypothetical protein